MRRKRRLPGYQWRTLAHPDKGSERVQQRYDGTEGVCFDELVVDDWFHMEQMNTRDWWIGLGGVMINVHIPAKGKPHILIEEDDPTRHDMLRVLKGKNRDVV
jgi:hypothetical protein